MNPQHCTADELKLIEAAKDALQLRRRAGKNTVCAGVLAADGHTYLGLDLVSRKSSVCAEPSAISSAHFNGSYDIASIVSVCFTPDLDQIVVISPCGACRELIWFHHPQARVLLSGDPEPIAVEAKNLFAYGELFPNQIPRAATHS